MSYCESGQTATVEYKFGDGETGKFQTKNTPVNVSVNSKTRNQEGAKYNPIGYGLIGIGNDGVSQTNLGIYINHRILTVGSEQRIQYWDCGATDWQSTTFSIGGILRVEKDLTRSCSPPYPDTDCELEITTEEGIILFAKLGKCPATYTVYCGNCPPGQVECHSNKYPGYCCIPCQQTASKINNLAAKVRGK